VSETLDIWNSAPKGVELEKAVGIMAESNSKKLATPKSAIIDPINTLNVLGTRSKPTAIPYQTLRRMSEIPAISAIIQTRLNQVGRFSRRPRYDGDIGFKIAMKDPEAKMSKDDSRRAKEIEEFLLTTGATPNRIRKDNLNTFLRKIVRDTLTLDVVAFEKVRSLRGQMSEIWAIDGATIELVINNPMGDEENGRMVIPVYIPETGAGQALGSDNIAYVQKVNGQVIAEFSEEDLAFAVRNPRTDIMHADFGMSELETLIEIATGIVNGIRYNTSYFSHSHLPQGVLEIVGKYEDKHLEAFKRHWKTMTSGAPGKWSVPVMAMEEGQGLKFTAFKNSNRDMEFNQFLEFLFNIACAVYQIDPNEVGFKSWTSGSGMTQSDNTSVKMDESKDKGFIPLMYFLSDTINSEIINLIDDRFVFEWVGVDEEDTDRKLEREKTKLDSGLMTVNMIRKENDQDEIDEDWANAPANAQLIQVYMAKMNQAMQSENEAKQQEQAGANRENEMQDTDASHKRQLEVMDKQHGQTLEQKKAEQEHQTNIEKMKAQAKPQQDKKPKPGDNLKKSLSEDDTIEVVVAWDDY
jgi:hypothetical protein